MDTTLTTLLAMVRRLGSIPNTASTGSADSDLIAYLNQHRIAMASEVIKCREGFYRYYKDTTVTSTQTRFRIPTRAIGNRLDAVLLLDSGGKVVRKLEEIPYGLTPNFRYLRDTMGYHIEAGDIVLTPSTPLSNITTLRMVYYGRPGEMSSSLDTASGKCFTVSTVTAVSATSVQLTITASHGLTTSSKVDVMKAGPPHEYLTIDNTPTAAASTTVTLTVDDSSRFEVGDFVCVADYAPVAQIPDAFLPVIALFAARQYWTALGDKEQVKIIDAQLFGTNKEDKGELGRAITLITPRVEEGTKKIMSYFGPVGSLYGPTRRVY